MRSPRQQIAISAPPPPPAAGIPIKGWFESESGAQINDALLGNHSNKQIHVKTRERLLLRAGEGFPKSRCGGERRRGSGRRASNEAIRQTIMSTCDADWHHAAPTLSAALKTKDAWMLLKLTSNEACNDEEGQNTPRPCTHTHTHTLTHTLTHPLTGGSH